jgi:hypothetical protein
VNVEAISMNKDHISMSKFSSSGDEDFQIICGHLAQMAEVGPDKIAQKWKLDREHGGL